jgi:hypothetical protein
MGTRIKSITTKVTAEEFAHLQRVAGDRKLSEWAREVLLSTFAATPRDVVLLAEVLALRTILLNLLFAVAAGETPTAETMRRLIERADHDKLRTAGERLTLSASEAR